MTTPFRETFRSLSSDGFRGSLFGMLGASTLVLGWGSWFVLARVPVDKASDDARFELVARVSSISASVAGRVVAVDAELGRKVEAGDVLVRLDTRELDDRLRELDATARMLTGHRVALAHQIEIEELALGRFRDSARARVPEERALLAAAEISATALEDEVERFGRLRTSDTVTELELIQVRARAEDARARAEALRLGLLRLDQDLAVQEEDRRARIEELRVESARLVGEEQVTAATAALVRSEAESRSLRAPEAGVVAERPTVGLGSVVAIGEEIVTIARPGPVQVSARFDAGAAHGHIRPGQPARISLTGFPWSEYGSLDARVVRVGSEARDGQIHVELELDATQASRIPVQHGLTASVRVEVERVAPIVLILRALGKLADPAAPSDSDDPAPGPSGGER